MAWKSSRGKLCSLATALVLLAGCYEQESIRSYNVKKETFRAAPAGLGRRPFHFTRPEGWDERPPDSPKGIFRAAVFRVREGEHSAEVAVVPLAGGGGGALANVNRWRMQIGLDPVDNDQLQKDLRKLETADGAASYVDLRGQGPTGPQRTLGAWLTHGGRTWFITMKGPPELVGKQQAAFEAFVKSIRFGDAGGAAHE